MKLDPKTSALILIDLQNGIVGLDLKPRTGGEIVETCKALADRFRAAGAPVVQVHVDFAPGNAPSQEVDAAMGGSHAPDWAEFVDGVRQDGDIVVLKHHWGAFTGTDLDLQLRRRGVKTVVMAGIATNYGVESTARTAWENSYHVVVAEDACTSMSQELHDFPFKAVFPRLGRVAQSGDISF